jgi:DNA-binding Xre family transcriptional regulator
MEPVMIRNKIKQFVDERGLTPYRFWKDSGIGKATAYELYNDSGRVPDNETIRRICAVYGCKTSDLIEIKDDE